ncbi:MAG: ATP-binding protein [Gemmatimonadetes bacterium]|nr:ATP-binding protein [Gemmatimonadota bacterium]
MSAQQDWTDANQARLLAGLAELRVLLERRARGEAADAPPDEALTQAGADERAALAALPAPSALDSLCAAFGLSAFERRLLLLCAGLELDGEFARLCAAAQGDAQRPFPTFGLALAALPEAHWSALTPASPLRLWRLIEVAPGDSLVASPLRIDERILHFLTGISYLDERLRPLLRAVEAPAALAPTQQAVAERVVELWEGETGELPAVQLCASDAAACQGVAAAASAALGAPLFVLRAAEIPTGGAEREQLQRLWQREGVLSGWALLVDCHEAENEARRAAVELLRGLRGPVFVAAREPLRLGGPRRVRLDVPRPTPAEQIGLWERALGEAAAELNGQVATAVEHFQLGSEGIQAASAQVLAQLRHGGTPADGAARLLWEACRVQARPRLDDLAERIEPAAAWDDLVLPAPQKEILRQIAANVAQRGTVYERWGFSGRGRRGLGISALFAGASGTGKTMAAEVLAGGLALDLYRIDLSQVVSKYIGETEKNLARVFDAAEEGGAVLLFDEADALFGKRSEVKDSHDRYANIEVSYLLQRMEAYRGLAILTTNMKSALDPAFLRRIRFLVQFPFPDAAQRAEIWRRIFPAATPTEGLDVARLARLNVAGGNIRNIALNAAFLAAAAAQPVRMEHLLRATRGEYAKLEKPLTDTEVAGWR